jgi:hypothetical protein
MDRKTQAAPLHRRRHGARIQGVVAEIAAGIDAGNDHIRQLVEQPGEGQVHAVGRRAVHAVEVTDSALDVQRVHQRERVRGAAAITVRRDDSELVATGTQLLGQATQARGHTAIVVRQENAHARGRSAECRP